MKTLLLIALFRTVELNMWMQGSRLSRIRENQRRSRARKREYLEGLEDRWKKCQELGVQANVELQKAARRVIEENAILRRILAELGWETARVDKRLQELKDMAIADGNDYNISCCDNGCGESGLDDVGRAMAGSLGNPQLPQPPSEPAAVSNIQNTLEGGIAAHPVNPDVPPSAFNPIFDLSILETDPDYECSFDITRFLESVTHPSPQTHHIYPFFTANKYLLSQFDLSPSPSPSGNSFTPTDQEISLSPNPSSIAAPDPPTPSPITLPLGCCSSSRTASTAGSTPCTEAYALLKALNSQRLEHKDMFEIVLELWNGFCYPKPGEDHEKGCRVDNDVLQKVIDRLK